MTVNAKGRIEKLNSKTKMCVVLRQSCVVFLKSSQNRVVKSVVISMFFKKLVHFIEKEKWCISKPV